MQKITKAIIPVAGLGTRFLPATKAQPKEMLTLVDKPVIQYIVEEAVAAGIENIIIITSQTKRAIEDHFDRNFELEYRLASTGKKKELEEVKKITKLANFIYIRQKSPRGWGDAILAAQPVLGNEPFAYLSGDDIIDGRIPAIKQLITVFNKYHDGVIGVTRVPKTDVQHYGIINAVPLGDRVYEIKNIVEKPDPKKTPSQLAVTGRYIFTPEIFDALRQVPLDSKGELVGTAGIKHLLKTRPFYAVEYEGTYYDCGSKLHFLEATVALALKHKEVASAFKQYLKNLQF
ncbi:MAG: UTP--glucose-1-phosphate uridylyltransferase GalU [bacterium]|nr:UTP--glucose-1-phosphate uridylyltransferase GalU [bacterium]